jgi:hypothetical protein
MHCWGDTDTHGFAILDRLRSRLRARGIVLDEPGKRLLAHASHQRLAS